MAKKIKIVYIAGSGRCGSTVLGQMLGELHGFVNIGEGRYLFTEQMRRKGIPCGCGASVDKCSFWGSIAQNISPKTISSITKWGRAKYFPALLLLRSLNMPLPFHQLRESVSEIEQIYKAIALQSGAQVIVDGSKHPTYGLLLTLSGAFDVYVVHLVRSAYAVAASWSRPKDYLKERSPAQVTLQWNVYNTFAPLVTRSKDRYMCILWESFLSNPEFYLKQICEFLGESIDVLQGLKRRDALSFYVDIQHVLSGNPGKLKTKRIIELQHSDWYLSKRRRAMVTLFAWPLLLKYNYLTTNKKK
mgnify:CR=1 FL=1